MGAGRGRRAWGRRATVGVLASVVLVGCGESKPAAVAPDPAREIRAAVQTLDAPLDRLGDAAAEATPSKRASLITLRASADRAGDALRRVRSDLRELETDPRARPRVRDAIEALEEVEAVADVLARPSLSTTELQVASERARQAVEDADLSLPEIETTRLVAAVRRSRRGRAPAKTTAGTPGVSAPVGEDAAGGSGATFETYSGPAFEARLPTSGGWAGPSQSEPTPGRLYRTSVRGPGGLFVIVDYTPLETAKFGGRYSTRAVVGQTAFGSMVRYVFTGGSLPECRRSPCVDYIINDEASGAGFGVLAGGGSLEAISTLARTVAESVTPSGDL